MRLRPPPRVDLPAPADRDLVEDAVELVRRARRELQESQAALDAAEAERIEAIARFEREFAIAEAACDAMKDACQRTLSATEAYTAALAEANSHGRRARALLELERLHFIGDEETP